MESRLQEEPPNLFDVVVSDTLAREGSDIIRFYRKDSGHRIGMAPVRDIPLDDHAVITSNVILVQPCIIMLRIAA